MLPEIIIASNISGLVRIGDTLLGEISRSEYLSFIGAGSFYLGFTPFTSFKIYAPISVKVTISQGAPVFECPYIHIFNYKDNVYMLELEPPCLAAHTLPVCLDYKRIENRFTASLIEQNSFYVVIEDDTKQLPDGFFPIILSSNPVMNIVSVNGASMVIVSDSCSHMYIFAKNEKGFYKALSLEADEYNIENDRFVIKKTTRFGHTLSNTYTEKNGSLLLSDTAYEINPLPADDIIIDFLECVKFGIEKRALSYLSIDLELSFAELKEFMGEFSEFRRSPFDENAYALIGRNDGCAYLVNRFSFEIIRGRINNIQEL